MARMMSLVLIAIALVFVFDVILNIGGGLNVVSEFFDLVTGRVDASGFFDAIFSIAVDNKGTLIGLTAGAIIAGLLARTQGENFIILAIIVETFVLLSGSFVSLITYSSSNLALEWTWVAISIKVFMGLFTMAYIITMIEFFRGNV